MGVDAQGRVYVSDQGRDNVQVFDANGLYLGVLTGSTLTDPQDVAVADNGTIYVTEPTQIKQFNSSFGFVGQFAAGVPLQAARDIDVDAAGNVYVINDINTDQLKKILPNGTADNDYGNGGAHAKSSGYQGLFVRNDGTAYIADWGDNSGSTVDDGVWVVQPNGVADDFFNPGNSFQEPRGVAVLANGNVVVGNDFQVTGNAVQAKLFNSTFAELILSWGDFGRAPGQFDGPSGVAVDAVGNTYVVDRSNDRVQVIDRDKNFLFQFGSTGTGNGQFDFPMDIAIDPNGSIFVTDLGTNRIQKFDALGNYLTSWGGPGTADGQFNALMGIAVGPDGAVYVADSGNDRIQKFDNNGTYLTKWGSAGTGNGQFGAPIDVAVDRLGNVYVADSNTVNRIQVFSITGVFKRSFGSSGTGTGQFDVLSAVAVDNQNNVYVLDNDLTLGGPDGRVQKFDHNGNLITVLARGLADNDNNATILDTLEDASALAVDRYGRVIVADTGNDRVMFYENLEAPVAYDDTYVANANTQFFGIAPGVLSNDALDFFGDPIFAELSSQPQHGAVFMGANGSFVYTPFEDYSGPDSFRYIALDQNGASFPATVNLTVSNPPPVAVDDTYATEHQTVLSVSAEDGVLANDSDPNNNPMTAEVLTQPQHGTLQMESSGAFTYTPAAGFGGYDTFTYRASDGESTSSPAEVSISVGFPLMEAPSSLGVTGNLTVGPVHPTLSWGHQTEAGQSQAPGEWYNIEITDSDDNIVLDEWFPAAQLCRRTSCSLKVAEDILFIGLTNGSYEWRVRSWAGGIFSAWSSPQPFTVSVPQPAVPIIEAVYPNQGRISVQMPDDPGTTWFYFNVRSTEGADTYEHFGWVQKRESDCPALTCTITLDAHPQNGTYTVFALAWGPDGYSQNSEGGWSAPVNVQLQFSAPPAVSSLTATNFNSGRPLFEWDATAGSTWYQLWVGTADFDTAYGGWTSAVDLGCVNPGAGCEIVPPLVLPQGDSFIWYVQSWGPGGFSTGGQEGWVKGPDFSVNAGPTGKPIALTPTGTINVASPYYAWNAVQNASWYRVVVTDISDPGVPVHDNWYPVEEVGCIKSSVCQIQLPGTYLADGDYFWFVTAYTPSGIGPSSQALVVEVQK